jgi:hypothetical protein
VDVSAARHLNFPGRSQMKTCSYCGKQYPDEVTVCPIDGKQLIGAGEGIPAVARHYFDIRLLSPFSRAGKYRVFVERNDLIFIQTGSRGSWLVEIPTHFLGPFGHLIPLVLWLLNRKGAKVSSERLHTASPEELLRENDANFKLYLAEIRDASVEAPSLLAMQGKYGRLILLVRHGEKFKGEFTGSADPDAAIRLLGPALNSTLRISPQWNEERRRFEKRRKGLTA